MWFDVQQADETLDFEEQILEAAKSIAAATSALVKSASAAQRELVAQGKVSWHSYSHTQQDTIHYSNKVKQHIQSFFFLFPQCLPQVGSNLANAVDDGQWSQGLISAVSCFNMTVQTITQIKKQNVSLTQQHVWLAVGAYGSGSHQ